MIFHNSLLDIHIFFKSDLHTSVHVSFSILLTNAKFIGAVKWEKWDHLFIWGLLSIVRWALCWQNVVCLLTFRRKKLRIASCHRIWWWEWVNFLLTNRYTIRDNLRSGTSDLWRGCFQLIFLLSCPCFQY